METMLAAYIACAIWSSTDFDGEPLDNDFGPEDIAPELLAEFTEDVRAFLEENAADIGDRYEKAGHDFWLTRNRHGAGFWDGDWPSDAGKRLTEAAHCYGSVDLTPGDDGMIY